MRLKALLASEQQKASLTGEDRYAHRRASNLERERSGSQES